MPTERFYRLSEAKKSHIRQAAIAEFSSVPFDKASINKIVQGANISRGSFYTYFEDKQDVVMYLFEDLIGQIYQVGTKALRERQGDFWFMIDQLAEYLKTLSQDSNIFVLAQNIFKNQDMDLEKAMRFKGRNWDQWVGGFFDLTDRSALRVENKTDYSILLEMCFHCILTKLPAHHKRQSEQELKESYEKKLEIIRYGVIK